MNQLVSIIIPVYNAGKYLRDCIDSVCCQAYTNIEILLINDGSTDDSGAICEEYASIDNRIKVEHLTNGGVSRARNIGISRSKGEIVTFVDSDDLIEQNHITNIVEALLENKVDCVRMSYIRNQDGRISSSGEVIDTGVHELRQVAPKKSLMESFLYGRMNCYVMLLGIKKAAMKDLLFREDIHMMEDVIFYMGLIERINSIYISDIPTYTYNIHKQSASKNVNNFVRNTIDSAKVNRYIYDNYPVLRSGYAPIAGQHISASISRYVGYIMAGGRVSVSTLKANNRDVLNSEAFQWLVGMSDISKLRYDLRLAVKWFNRGSVVSLYLLIYVKSVSTKFVRMIRSLV